MATLYVVATPIGNLEDITLRAIRILKEVDHIFAEDTRVTAKLLAHFEINKPISAYHQHSDEGVINHIVELLKSGKVLALVSDAGTPGINDPGGRLIQEVLSQLPETQIVPIPGPNAAVTALSVSGFPADNFTYLGFVPHKKGRKTFLRSIAETENTIVFYESKYRIDKCLVELAEDFNALNMADRQILVARELTKKFETLYRGTVDEVIKSLQAGEELGEFVVVVGPKG